MQTAHAQRGFDADYSAIVRCHGLVLNLPSGRSAHLGAGLAIGMGKPVFIYMPYAERPELMYKAATAISDNCIS